MESYRARLLFKARALLDARLVHRIITRKLTRKGLSLELQREIVALADAFPSYLQPRVAEEQALPLVDVVEDEGLYEDEQDNEELVARVNYALGLEGGVGTATVGGGEPQVGIPKEAFGQLWEMLAPRWAREDM